MAKLILILMTALVFEAIGVVFLSKGIKQIDDMTKISTLEIVRIIRTGATNANIILGVFFEALFFAGLLILLSKAEVSFIWPLTSLSFVMTAIAAKLFLHEQIDPARWTGIFLIMAGAALITWGEQNKKGSATGMDRVAQSPGLL
jgi:drug/metabolite transporter (DMT)-like permease